MSKLEFLNSEYEYCLDRYTSLGYISYFKRMLELEKMIKEETVRIEIDKTDLIDMQLLVA